MQKIIGCLFSMRVNTIAISIAIGVGAYFCPSISYSKVPLEEIVDNIASAESLFSNISFDVRMELQGSKNVNVKDKRYEDVESEVETTRFVSQDGRFFVDRQATTNGTSGTTVESHRQVAYDGAVTRINASNQIGNIIHARQTGTSYVFPHSIGLRQERIHMPLSTFLSTKRHKSSSWTVSVEPDAETDGFHCHVVRHESRTSGGKLALWRRIWLAPARTWFPVRIEVYMTSFSARLPRATVVAQDFRELEPGVWFPYSVIRTLNEEDALMKGIVQILTTTKYSFSDVKLNPGYDDNFFQQVTFSPGMRVYEKKNGKIVKNYRVPEPPAERWVVWLMLAVGVGIALLATTWIVRRRSSQPKSA